MENPEHELFETQVPLPSGVVQEVDRSGRMAAVANDSKAKEIVRNCILDMLYLK